MHTSILPETKNPEEEGVHFSDALLGQQQLARHSVPHHPQVLPATRENLVTLKPRAE